MLTINALMSALVAELEAEEVVTPLARRFTLANIWSDLARLAGEELPAAAVAVVADALDTICEPLPLPLRGSYHVPAGASYSRTIPEDCFATEAAAQAAGYRRAQR